MVIGSVRPALAGSYERLFHEAQIPRFLQEYEQRLREARLAIFKAQEVRRQAAQKTRAAAVAEAQEQALAALARNTTTEMQASATTLLGTSAAGTVNSAMPTMATMTGLLRLRTGDVPRSRQNCFEFLSPKSSPES